LRQRLSAKRSALKEYQNAKKHRDGVTKIACARDQKPVAEPFHYANQEH
jgi:hypothetical protein